MDASIPVQAYGWDLAVLMSNGRSFHPTDITGANDSSLHDMIASFTVFISEMCQEHLAEHGFNSSQGHTAVRRGCKETELS